MILKNEDIILCGLLCVPIYYPGHDRNSGHCGMMPRFLFLEQDTQGLSIQGCWQLMAPGQSMPCVKGPCQLHTQSRDKNAWALYFSGRQGRQIWSDRCLQHSLRLAEVFNSYFMSLVFQRNPASPSLVALRVSANKIFTYLLLTQRLCSRKSTGKGNWSEATTSDALGNLLSLLQTLLFSSVFV